MPLPAPILDIERRLVAQATASDDGEAIFAAFCEALVAAGLPLWRASLSVPTIDPLFRGANLTWRASQGFLLSLTQHGPAGDDDYVRSPIQALHQAGQRQGRWRLADTHPDLPLLARLKSEGATDYVLHVAEFAPGTALVGAGISFATDRPEGFTAEHLALIAELVPTVALVTAKLTLAHTLHEVVRTYLGERTGARVLAGQMQRGQGTMVPAVILLADLRGFTALANRHAAPEVVGWLNAHFDALCEPVAAHGGEILKFLGDGFLAIFPVTDPDEAPCSVCAAGLRAAREGLARNRVLNAARAQAGLPSLEADLVLHYGPVVYGNVGTDRRLDFTIIGPAVNEASRLEGLCAELGRSLLLSDAFAARCGPPLTPLGTFTLRGIEGMQRVWALDEDAER